MLPALRPDGENTLISCRIQPRARRSGIAGFVGNALKITVNAPPVDGKANSALIKLVADWFDVPLSRVSVRRGESSRDKVLEITALAAESADRILSEIIKEQAIKI